jgi:hypothetical protein
MSYSNIDFFKRRDIIEMRELHLRFKDGDKEAELSMNDVDQHSKLAMIDGIFQFLDIGINLKEMSETYIKIGQAYKTFYDPIEPEYNEAIKKIPKKKEEDPKPKVKKENDIKDTFKNYPDHYVTGIKYDDNEAPLYKVRYKCPECLNQSNKYIKPRTNKIKSHCCDKLMDVSPATTHGDPKEGVNPELYRDSYGNFYVAGLQEKEIITMNDKE